MANKQNIARLIERLERVQKEDPENYDQRYWFCGTAACIGAHACLMDGWERVSPGVVKKDDRELSIMRVAQEILGLIGDEADELFHCGGRNWAEENRNLLQSSNARKRVQGAIQELRRYL